MRKETKPNEEKCHICNASTDFCCQSCGQPVCENCCVPMTYMNQIDYALCAECGDARETSEMVNREREFESQEKALAKKEKRAAARKANYRKPENVAKRKAKKIALLLERKKRREEAVEETMKIVESVFRGIF